MIAFEEYTHLTPGVHLHHHFGLVLHFLEGEDFAVVALQVLLLQRDHHPPAGRRAGAPQQSHVLGHGFREKLQHL